MAKPDPALLDPARYPFTQAITTRYADVDPNQHLNNVALASLCEDARVRFNHAVGRLSALPEYRAMVASFAIEYLAEGYFPDPVEGRVAVERVGNSSWTMVQLIIQNGALVAFARSTVVCIKDNRPSPIPDDMRAKLANWLLRA